MRALLVALCAMCALTSLPAQANFESYDYETSQVRPGPRPNPGRPGPYPGPVQPTPPRPNPPRPPAPPYPGYPPPPPRQHIQHVSCTSYNYRYNECYFSAYSAAQIRIIRQHSYDACVWGRTAGAYNNRVWVDRGCSATFEIISFY